MSKSHKRKLIWIMLFTAALVFYVRTVPQVSLNDRAIVVGLGIDYDAEKGYTLTAQIINPVRQDSAGGAADNYGIAFATAETLADAIGIISLKTGLTVSLSQCNILIFGNSLTKIDFLPSINYLVQNFQIPENSILALTDGTAGDLLRAKPILTPISSFYMQQTLTAMAENEGVINTVIKDFSESYLSDNGVSAIAYVTAKEIEQDNTGSSGGSASSEGDKYYEFDYSKCALFAQKRPPLLLNGEDTKAINMMMRKTKKGGATVTVDGLTYSLSLSKKKYSYDVAYENGRLNYAGKIKVAYSISEVKNMGTYFSISEIPDDVLDKIAAAVGCQLAEEINSTYAKCKEQNYDVFRVYGAAYSHEGTRWKNAVSDDYLNLVDFSIKADITVTRK